MYAFSSASCKVVGFVSAAFGLGASLGFGVEPFGSVGFGLAVSAGFTSAGFGASVVVTEGVVNCSDNLDNFASSSAIFSTRSFFVLV